MRTQRSRLPNGVDHVATTAGECWGSSSLAPLMAASVRVAEISGEPISIHVGDRVVQAMHADGVGVFAVSTKHGHATWAAKRRMAAALKRALSSR